MKQIYNSLLLFSIIIVTCIIVIFPFTNQENFYNEKLNEENIVVYKNSLRYNLGDLLCMPKLYGDHIKTLEHEDYRNTIEVYKDSILAIYESLRKSPEEPIPNITTLQESVDVYIERNKSNKKLMENIEFVSKPNVLCVHLRTGDYGAIADNFKQIIFDLQKEYEYVVIMCGVHYGNKDVYDIFLNSVNVLFENDFKNLFISIEDPDVHMAMFRCCHNLLLCKNGFTMLAGMIFKGDKLYICKEVFDQNFSISQSSWMEYMQPETRIFNELIYV